jgi:hypothetical protein
LVNLAATVIIPEVMIPAHIISGMFNFYKNKFIKGKMMKNLSADWKILMEDIFKDMVRDLKDFEGKMKEYKLENDKIVFNNTNRFDHRRYGYDFINGYLTTFAYFEEHDKRTID